MGWIPHSTTYCHMRVGSYCYIPSCQVPKTTASRGLERAMFIRYGEPPDTFDRGPESLPRVIERSGGQISGEISLAHANHRVEK
jgi:hypothetical protein